MRKFINNLRDKPESVRRHILHVTVAVFAVILISLWVFSLGTTFSSTTTAGVSEDLKPFSALKANIIGGYNSITGPTTEESQ
jgi:hypothetical protein